MSELEGWGSVWLLLGPGTRREGIGALCASQGIFCGRACEVLEGTFQPGWEWGLEAYLWTWRAV